MNLRPHLNTFQTKTDRMIERVNFILFLFLWVFTIFSFQNIPEIIPVHFDASGMPDRYGHKWNVFMLPLISSIIYAGLRYLARHPWIFNYTKVITRDNFKEQYLSAAEWYRC